MSKKLKLLTCVGFLLVLAVLIVLATFNLKQEEVKIKERIGYTVECQTKDDDNKSMNIWFKDYMKQFKQKGLDKALIVNDYSIKKAELLGANVIEIDFAINSQKSNPKLEKIVDGTFDSKSWLINCQWVLKYQSSIEKGKIYYRVTDVYDPGKKYKNNEFKEVELKKEESAGADKTTKEAYDKKYKTADDVSREAYNKEFMQQAKEPRLNEINTYRIYNDICSISYDRGKNWTNVPIALEELCRVMDGNSYFNKLQNGSYVISPERTILTYGGTKNTALSIIKSSDKGKTWKKVQVDKDHKIIYSGRLKFISFASEKVGYIVVTTERAMNTEAKSVFKTIDGGDSWTEISPKTNINTHKLYKASFLSEKLGFMSMVCNEEPEIYRTEDGGETWSVIGIATMNSYKQPEIPYFDNGKMYLLVNEGDDSSNNKKALYVSGDNGKSFKFEKEVGK
jgi:hypothetical protein